METVAQDNIRELDPFGFWPDYASALRPLGGQERGPDPRYIFHTPYVEFAPGRVLFTIRFEQLQASFGEMRVFINAFVPGSGRDAVFVTSSRIELNDRSAVERGMTISILTVPGATYAALGLCQEGTDARAAKLIITAEQSESEGTDSIGFLLPTQLGSTPLDLPAKLVGDDAPTLRHPVSQTMTSDQLAEPEFQHWTSRLPAAPTEPSQRWRLAFIAQALDRYGMLRRGARAIAAGEGCAAMAPIMAEAECEATLAALSDEHVSDFAWHKVLCSRLDAAADPAGLIQGTPLSLADQPADARGFDMMWTIGVAQRGYEAGHCANFLVEMMAVLRPGGYAVHMTDLAAPREDSGSIMSRREIERLAVTLISRGFTVAQLNFTGLAEALSPTPFGLIVRRD